MRYKDKRDYKKYNIVLHWYRGYYLSGPGHVDEVDRYEESRNHEHHPGRGAVLVPAQVLAQPQ